MTNPSKPDTGLWDFIVSHLAELAIIVTALGIALALYEMGMRHP